MVRQQVVMGAAVLLGLLVLAGPGRADEASAVKAIEKLGGRVTVNPERPGKPVVGVDFNNPQLTDAGLKGLKDLKSLQTLSLIRTAVTDAGLKKLKEFKSLRELDPSGTQVTDAGLKELKELKGLKTLGLGRKITDKGLKELKE